LTSCASLRRKSRKRSFETAITSKPAYRPRGLHRRRAEARKKRPAQSFVYRGRRLILYRAARPTNAKLAEVTNAVIRLFQA